MKIQKIDIEEFAKISQKKVSTIKRNYKRIPGLTLNEGKFDIIKGTRYPCDLHRYKIENSADRRYLLLKTISEYKYICNIDLKIHQEQFVDLIRELLDAELIKENHLYNHYGANAYDCTAKGDIILKKQRNESIKEITDIVATATGKFVGSVISEVVA